MKATLVCTVYLFFAVIARATPITIANSGLVGVESSSTRVQAFPANDIDLSHSGLELRDFEAQYLEGRGVPGAGGSKVANLFDNSKAVLNQAIIFLDKYISSDDQLTKPSEFIPGSTIGKHLRHALDHFDVLMKSVSSSGSPPYRLSYDQKERDTSIESNLSAAKSAISTCIKLLNEHASSTQLDTPIILEAVTPAQVELKTTFGRELWSASMHCVHHWAMIRMIAGEHHIRLDVDKDFGYAPSTLVRYQSKI